MPQAETPTLRRGLRVSSDGPGHRRDIQGLRALAVSLVLLYHLWPHRLTGGYVGVDVFFVISGFLITSHLLNARPDKPRDLATFWMRRIRRLLPAALLVLMATLLASRLFAPDSQWKGTAHEAIAAALYGENWNLAARAVDYLAAATAPSPIQHYWSLSVEEQFYAVWPILVLIAVLIARRLGRSVSSTLLVGLSVIVASSLAYSIYATAAEPSSAYFITPTRVWELGVGGLLAVLLIRSGSRDDGFTDVWHLPPWGRSTLAWLGFAAILWTAFTFTDATPFPGDRALLPVLGAAAVLAAHAQSVGSPGPFLAWSPIQYLGDISYSLYLWHWPLIVIVPQVTGSALGLLDKLAIIAGSVALAGLTKKYVEDRYRRHRPGVSLATPYRFAVAGMAVVVAVGLVQVAEVNHRQEAAKEQVSQVLSGAEPCFGAASMAPGNSCIQRNSGNVIPSTSEAANDRSDAFGDGCLVYRPFDKFTQCVYGDEKAAVSIALVGNSHAAQWLPALQELAATHHWKITTFLASQCFATSIRIQLETEQFRRNCFDWGQKVLAATPTGTFDLVVTSERTGRAAIGVSAADSYGPWKKGYAPYLQQWADRGVKVLVIRDNPFPISTMPSVPDCVGAHPDDFAKCSAPRTAWLRPDPLADAAKGIASPKLTVADLTNYFCMDVCSPVIGKAMVYVDGSHITQTFARTLAPYLEPYVRKALVYSPN